MSVAHDRGYPTMAEWLRSAARDIEGMSPCMAGHMIAAAEEIEALRVAAKDCVLAYEAANPVRTAAMHDAKCGCLRCEIDRLDYACGGTR